MGVAVAYVDYAKAFDVVNHSKLFLELSAYDNKGDLFEWIRSYFSKQTQCTRVNQECSNYADIVSGVIQGITIVLVIHQWCYWYFLVLAV